MAAAAASRTDLDQTDEEELLLIVSGMGSLVQSASPDEPAGYMIGADCKECIADLQRYLRRDDPMVMAAHRALGSWRVLQTHLIPLLGCIGSTDTKLTFNVLKVIVKLTMKPEQLATRMVDHLKERKTPDPLIGARVDELMRYHRAYKRAYTRGDAMGNLVWLLGKGLSVSEAERSEEESMLIELLLALVLNVLHTSHPDAPPPDPGKTADVIADKETLRALLRCMEREHTLETMLYILQQVEESPAFRSFNLTLLEIVYYALSAQSAESLYSKAPPPKPKTANEAAALAQGRDVPEGADAAAHAEAAAAAAEEEAAGEEGAAVEGEEAAEEGMEEAAAAPSSVRRGKEKAPSPRTNPGSRLQREQPGPPKGVLGNLLASKTSHLQSVMAGRPSRHGNFGGAFKVNTAFGTQHVAHALTSSGDAALPTAGTKKRASRARMPMSAPLELRKDPKTEGVLKGFVGQLLEGPFNSLMGTVVKDLEGYAFGSNANNAGKVLMQDHTFFAATASWLLHAHILQQQERRQKDPDAHFDVGPVGALADASVFLLATRNCRELLEKKAWLPLGVFASLMRQLFTFLDEMVRYGDDKVVKAATVIQRQVFYEQQILEMLKGMVTEYEPHKMPPTYMADCAIMAHAVMRQLEGYGGLVLKKKAAAKKAKAKKAKAAAAAAGGGAAGLEFEHPGGDDDDDDDGGATGGVLEESALDFEHELYKFVGNRDIVVRYVGLLSHFQEVPPMAVHCALKMISRLIKQVKLEAMLFQLSILTTISNILDSPIAKRPEHEELYATCKYITRRFFAVAKENPALFVEVLVWKRPAECEEILSGYGKRVHEQSRRQQLEEMAMSGGGSGGGGSAGVGMPGDDDEMQPYLEQPEGMMPDDEDEDEDGAYIPLEPLEEEDEAMEGQQQQPPPQPPAAAAAAVPMPVDMMETRVQQDDDEEEDDEMGLPSAAAANEETEVVKPAAADESEEEAVESGADEESEEEDEDGATIAKSRKALKSAKRKAKEAAKEAKAKAAKASRKRAKKWSNEEDEKLMGLWSQYGGTADWEHIISGFFGGERSAVEVKNRAKKLNLLRKQKRQKEAAAAAAAAARSDESDEEEDDDDDDDAVPAPKAARPAARAAAAAAAAASDDDSEPPSLPPSEDEEDEEDEEAAPKEAAAASGKRKLAAEEAAAPPAKAPPAYKRRAVIDSDDDE